MNFTTDEFSQLRDKATRLRGHELFPQEVLQPLPALYKTEGMGSRAIAQIKIFHPLSNWYWYFSEFDGIELFFGLTIGHASEFGYTPKTEMEISLIRGIPFERDLYFKPMTIEAVIEHHRKLEPDRDYPTFD